MILISNDKFTVLFQIYELLILTAKYRSFGVWQHMGVSQVKCALNLHLICTQILANFSIYRAFFDALMLILITKFLPNSTIRKLSPINHIFNYDAKFAPNTMQIRPKKYQKSSFSAPLRRLMQTWYIP